MVYVLTIFWTFLDVAGVFLLADGFFLRLRSLRQIIWALMCTVAAIFVYFYSPIGDFLPHVFTFSIISAAVWWCYRASYLFALLLTIMYQILIGTVEVIGGYGISAFLGITYHELVWKKLLYTATVSSCKLIELFICYMTRKLQRGRKVAPIRTSWLVLTIVFPLFSFTLLFFIYVTFETRGDLSVYGVIFSVILVLANIAILYLLNLMEKRTREDEEFHLLNQQMELQTASIMALEKSYRAQRAATHEFRNQLRTLGELLAAGETERASDYIRELQQTEAIRDLPVRTRHPIMDAILNHKYQLAQEHGIDIQFQVSDLSELTLRTDAMVVLFTNLLDNAIEACCRCDGDRTIRCSIIAEDGLFLSVKNTSLPVVIENATIRTTKDVPQDHGYGLMSIQRILKELDAEYSFDYQNGWFRFAAELPEV